MVDRLLTQSEVAEWLQVSPRTVRGWRERGLVPFVRTPGGAVRFHREQVAAAIQGDLNPSVNSARMPETAAPGRPPSERTK